MNPGIQMLDRVRIVRAVQRHIPDPQRTESQPVGQPCKIELREWVRAGLAGARQGSTKPKERLPGLKTASNAGCRLGFSMHTLLRRSS